MRVFSIKLQSQDKWLKRRSEKKQELGRIWPAQQEKKIKRKGRSGAAHPGPGPVGGRREACRGDAGPGGLALGLGAICHWCSRQIGMRINAGALVPFPGSNKAEDAGEQRQGSSGGRCLARCR